MSKNILLVDKDKETINANKSSFEERGCQVRVASDSVEALKMVDESMPDIVITEIMLEHVDSGFTLCHTLKNKYPELPIFILSDVIRKTGINFSTKTKEEKAWIKADEFIDKPVNPQSLLCMVQRFFEQNQN